MLIILFISCTAAAQTPSDMETDLKAHPTHLSTRIQLANIYLRQQQFEKVIALLNSYTDQLTSEGFLALAEAYSSMKNYVDEVRVLNVLVTKEEDHFQWEMLLGQAYIKESSVTKDEEARGKMDTFAITHLRKAFKLNPKYKPIYDVLLNTLLRQKVHNEARELLIESVGRFGERPETFRELCRLDSLDGFLDSALKNCRQAIQAAPNYPDNYVYLVQTLYDEKEDQKAEKDIVGAARKFPSSEFVQWAAGVLFFKKKNYPVAARYFEAAVKADPTAKRSQFGLAQSLFESGDEKGSYDHFVKACDSDPVAVEVFLAAGGRLKQKGNSALGEKFVHSAYNCKN
jgi:tetratricopeptide (TPR) repeat protein